MTQNRRRIIFDPVSFTFNPISQFSGTHEKIHPDQRFQIGQTECSFWTVTRESVQPQKSCGPQLCLNGGFWPLMRIIANHSIRHILAAIR
jgi:hypothetical protein